MFDNIGRKIKNLAMVITVLGIIVSVILGLIVMVSNSTLGFLGFFIILIGSFFSWISSWFLYGFGELIESTSDIAEYARKKHRMLKSETEKNIFTMNKNTTNK